MTDKELNTFTPSSRKEWRKWLMKNHGKEESVWLICYRINTGKPSISWSDAVDEALCFGWIDSTRVSINDESFRQFFTRRKPGSVWSKINKEKVERLISEGLMTDAGLKAIEVSKQNGQWNILDEVEQLIIPEELSAAFKKQDLSLPKGVKGAKAYFESLSKSMKKMMLSWIAMAKRPETKAKRIEEIALLAAKQQRPKQFM